MEKKHNRPVHEVEFPSEYLPDTHATGEVMEDAQLEPAGQSGNKRREKCETLDTNCTHQTSNKSNNEEKVKKKKPVQEVALPSEYLPDTHATGNAFVVAQLEPAGQSVTNEGRNVKHSIHEK
jgi:hypothetical protein